MVPEPGRRLFWEITLFFLSKHFLLMQKVVLCRPGIWLHSTSLSVEHQLGALIHVFNSLAIPVRMLLRNSKPGLFFKISVAELFGFSCLEFLSPSLVSAE
jgi:hypothetical protein